MVRAVHDAASLFPLLVGDEFKALKANIKKHGQQMAISRLDGKILDGRNRLRAIEELDLEPWIEDLDPEETGDPWVFVMSANYHRRHLSALAKGRSLAAYMKLRGGKKQPRKRTDTNGASTAPTLGAVAKELGIKRTTAQRQIQAAEDFETLPLKVQARVEAGDFSVTVAIEAMGEAQPSVNGDPEDEALDPEDLEVFNKAAELRKKINGLMTFLERTASGFAHHEEFALGRRWGKAESDIIKRHMAAIHKSQTTWRKKL